MNSIAAIISIFILNGTWAQAAPITCDEIGLTSLYRFSEKADTDEFDFCRDPINAPPAIQKTLLQIQKIHEKIAAFYHRSISELFSEKLSLKLQEHPAGFMISAFHRPSEYSIASVTLGIFSDFSGEINEAVYVHELGHYFNETQSSQAVPQPLRSMINGFIFFETMADLLAINISGATSSIDSTLPRCFSEFRVVTESQSYSEPIAFFDPFSFPRTMQSCCSESLKNGDYDLKAERLCHFFKSQFKKLPPPNLNALNHDWAASMGMDFHQIGLPLQSFFLELTKKTGISLKSLMLDIFASVSLSSSPGRYSCGIPGDEKRLNWETIEQPTTEIFLKNLRAHFASKGMASIFDSLWQKHAIPILLEVSTAVDEFQLSDRRLSVWLKDPSNALSGQFRQHQCYQPDSGGFNPKSECLPVCQELK